MKKEQWLEDLFSRLPQDPFKPGNRPSDDILQREVLANEWEKQLFTQHFLGRLRVTREILVRELIEGSRDKWGNENADAKRAVIRYCDTILGYLSRIRAEASIIRLGEAQMTAKAKRLGGPIHGEEPITR